jgi:hypothetical protein
MLKSRDKNLPRNAERLQKALQKAQAGKGKPLTVETSGRRVGINNWSATGRAIDFSPEFIEDLTCWVKTDKL